MTEKVNNDYTVSSDFKELGILQYPFDKSLFYAGQSTRLFRIRLAVPPGQYHIIFDAEGKEGDVTIWDIRQEIVSCKQSSK